MTALEWVLVAVAAALLVGCVLLAASLRRARVGLADERAELAVTRGEVGRLRERVAVAEIAVGELEERLGGLDTPAGSGLDHRSGAHALDHRGARGLDTTGPTSSWQSLDQRGAREALERRRAETRVDRQVVERMVRLAGVVHGVRRAMSPEGRNRVRFEYKQAVKRARKQRKAETRQAVREYRAKVKAARQESAA